MQADRRRFIQWTAGLAASSTVPYLSAPALAKNASTCTYSGAAFGTQWHLVIGADQHPDTALYLIEQLLRSIDASISPYREESTLSHFNQSAVGTRTDIDAHLSQLIHTSITVAKQSNGAFDPTVGPLVSRFGFGPIKGSENCDFRDIQCSNTELIKGKSGLTLDLCGLGKGFAVDRISHGLKRLGYQHFLFDIGGEFAGIGRHPSGRPWLIAIEPDSDAPAQKQIVSLTDSSMATAGLQHNHFVYKGKLYGHLVDQKNKVSAQARCHSVSVMHASATLADAWSTALYVAGPERGVELAHRYKLNAYFMTVDTAHEASISTGTFLTQRIEG